MPGPRTNRAGPRRVDQRTRRKPLICKAPGLPALLLPLGLRKPCCGSVSTLRTLKFRSSITVTCVPSAFVTCTSYAAGVAAVGLGCREVGRTADAVGGGLRRVRGGVACQGRLAVCGAARARTASACAGVDAEDVVVLVEDDGDVRSIALGDVNLVRRRRVAAVGFGRRGVDGAAARPGECRLRGGREHIAGQRRLRGAAGARQRRGRGGGRAGRRVLRRGARAGRERRTAEGGRAHCENSCEKLHWHSGHAVLSSVSSGRRGRAPMAPSRP